MQECLKVGTLSAKSRQEQSMAGPWIDRAKDYSLGVVATDRNYRWLSPKRPAGTQWRKQQQVRFILEQQNCPWRKRTKFPPNLAFFFRAPDLGQEHISVASRNIPVREGVAEQWSQTRL